MTTLQKQTVMARNWLSDGSIIHLKRPARTGPDQHITRRYHAGQTQIDRGEKEQQLGNCLGVVRGKAVMCWLTVGMEHLIITCLFSDGLHGIAHLSCMSKSLHGARAETLTGGDTNTNTVQSSSLVQTLLRF